MEPHLYDLDRDKITNLDKYRTTYLFASKDFEIENLL